MVGSRPNSCVLPHGADYNYHYSYGLTSTGQGTTLNRASSLRVFSPVLHLELRPRDNFKMFPVWMDAFPTGPAGSLSVSIFSTHHIALHH